MKVKLSLFKGFFVLIYFAAKMDFILHFWKLVNTSWKNSMHIMVLHVKLQPKRTKSVEMRAKSIWRAKFMDFFNVFFELFNFWPFFRHVILQHKNVIIPNRVIKNQNGPDSLKFCHLSGLPMMLFGLSNKLILFSDHYQTTCILTKAAQASSQA